MATTIGRITEQIQRLINAGDLRDDVRFESEEIRLLVNQTLNRLLRAERIQLSVPEGEYLPENAAMYAYEYPSATEAAVQKYGKWSIKLPQVPMPLPMGMGVYKVVVTNDDTGQIFDFIYWDPLLNEAWGTYPYGYHTIGDTLFFNAQSGINMLFNGTVEPPYKITVYMVGVDLDLLGDWDILPVSSDMEDSCIREVLTLLGAASLSDTTNDGSSQK